MLRHSPCSWGEAGAAWLTRAGDTHFRGIIAVGFIFAKLVCGVRAVNAGPELEQCRVGGVIDGYSGF